MRVSQVFAIAGFWDYGYGSFTRVGRGSCEFALSPSKGE